MSVLDDPLVVRAAAYAAACHWQDRRKGSGDSYFAGHLEPVARLVADAGGDAVQVAAAYLHDTAEDHGGRARLDHVADVFGSEVATIVGDLSDSLVDTSAGETKEPWAIRKRAYIDNMTGKSERSLVVAAADKLHNATAIRDDYAAFGDDLWRRFSTADPADHLWYYGTLSQFLTERLGDHPTAVRLASVVAELEAAVSEGS